MTTTPAPQPTMDIVLVTGISGSGKSVAMDALEDAGYYCVDNLPPELLPELIRIEQARGVRRLSAAVDVRSGATSLTLLTMLAALRTQGHRVRSIFLNATTPVLIKRFSETRRPHPLSKPGASSDGHRQLFDAIELERALVADLREGSTELDTSQLRAVQLRQWLRDLVGATDSALTLVFQSFAFKHGVPLDADFVFDVRMLPNPHYEPALRPLTGRDAPVAAYLQAQSEVGDMLDQIDAFLRHWLPSMENDQRSYVTVCIGCTGGQHRSVYLVEQLAARFAAQVTTLKRHRELASEGSPPTSYAALPATPARPAPAR
ncbi:MAG: RNase adapter RapZ [Proteobacteria bacterium]|nr:RNase adapter RapZ [Pseudomonadota bacterium]